MAEGLIDEPSGRNSLSGRGISGILAQDCFGDITPDDHTNKHCCAGKMNTKIVIALLFSASLMGCSQRMSYSELTSKIETGDMPSIVYRGSDEEAHYLAFQNRRALMQFPPPRTQHIKLSPYTTVVKDPLPLTEDESKWRRYALFLSSADELYLDKLSGRRFYEDFRPAAGGGHSTRAQQTSGLKGLQP